MESRTQGSRPRAKDAKKFRGPRPRTKDIDASVLRKKKGLQKILKGGHQKKGLKKFFSGEKGLKIFFFRRSPREGKQKKIFANFPRGFSRFFNKILTVQDIVLSSTRGQGNFQGT